MRHNNLYAIAMQQDIETKDKRILKLEKQRDELLEALKRSVVLMDATKRMFEENRNHAPRDMTVVYDEAECDGYCLIDDINIAIGDAEDAVDKAEE